MKEAFTGSRRSVYHLCWSREACMGADKYVFGQWVGLWTYYSRRQLSVLRGKKEGKAAWHAYLAAFISVILGNWEYLNTIQVNQQHAILISEKVSLLEHQRKARIKWSRRESLWKNRLFQQEGLRSWREFGLTFSPFSQKKSFASRRSRGLIIRKGLSETGEWLKSCQSIPWRRIKRCVHLQMNKFAFNNDERKQTCRLKRYVPCVIKTVYGDV